MKKKTKMNKMCFIQADTAVTVSLWKRVHVQKRTQTVPIKEITASDSKCKFTQVSRFTQPILSRFDSVTSFGG